jgi:N-acetylmuramoyl-L-alanine amidase
LETPVVTRWTPSGELIVAGTRFAADAPLVNWTEGPRWDATSERCTVTETDPHPPCTVDTAGNDVPYGKLPDGPYTRRYGVRPALRGYGWRLPPLSSVQAVIRQFVIHHDGCGSSDMCFSVAQNERGLSVHFLIDNDGTIFQTLDLAWMAYHASEWNPASIGVELCNRGDARREPHYYDDGRHGPRRAITPCTINGARILAFDYTPAQLDALARLCRALQRVLPALPVAYPQDSPGVATWRTLARGDADRFAGYLGHYHLTARKWDPGPLDFKALCGRARGVPCFPLAPRRGQPPRLDDDALQARADAEQLYAANERHAGGGFFPVGPWGEARLWHGGVHLTAELGAPVYAPFAGRVVAARMGASSPIGSVNFVLLRHELDLLAGRRGVFHTLVMHVQDELAAATRPGWLDRVVLAPGNTALVDAAVAAGDVIAHVATVGPGELARPQVHVEILAGEELFAGISGSPWTVVDGSAGGRFCDAPEIDAVIDGDGNGRLDRDELAAFYAGGGGRQLRYLVTRHVSEWTARPSWPEALRVPADFRDWPPAALDRLVADQIAPTLWWDGATAAHCGLPVDGVVYHYHPISFISWVERLGPSTLVATDPTAVAVSATDDAARSGDDCDADATLADLAAGFDTGCVEARSPEGQ